MLLRAWKMSCFDSCRKPGRVPREKPGIPFPASGSAQASEPQRVGAMPLLPLRQALKRWVDNPQDECEFSRVQGGHDHLLGETVELVFCCQLDKSTLLLC